MRKRTVCDNQDLMKYGRVEDACKRYSLGRCTIRKLATDAGAVIHVGKSCLINISKMDAYLEELAG